MNKIDEILTRGVEEAIVAEDIRADLNSGKKLRVKLGIDPTAPDIHLGHTVALKKLKQFQDAGHQVILIVGDFTATIGDPSGRNEIRKPLTREEVRGYMKGYESEIGKVIDLEKTEIRYNSEWYDRLGTMFLFELASKITVTRALERDDFQNRLKNNQDISMLEVLYPLFQGYDSVEVKADIEIGGTDQKFNLLMGRKVQKRYGQKPQNIMTVPLIEGLDGVRKMSKSYDNYIGIKDEPNVMFGKVMSIPDSLIIKYFKLLTDVSIDKIEKMSEDIKSPNKVNPRDLKVELAKEIITEYHNKKAAEDAFATFQQVFVNNEMPDEILEVAVTDKNWPLAELMHFTGLTPSKTEARRLIEQGGVRVDGAVIGDREATIRPKSGSIVQVGKRKFVRIKLDK